MHPRHDSSKLIYLDGRHIATPSAATWWRVPLAVEIVTAETAFVIPTGMMIVSRTTFGICAATVRAMHKKARTVCIPRMARVVLPMVNMDAPRPARYLPVSTPTA